MTLPANDAFTLGLPHDSSSRPTYSLGLRSSSPKLPFVTSSKSSHSPASPTKPPPATRRPSRGARSTSPDLRRRVSHRSDPDGSTPAKDATALAKASPSSSRPASPPEPIDWEIPRKALHSSIGFFTLYLYVSHGSSRAVVKALSLALAVIVPADVLRLNSPSFERLYERVMGFLMRESEKKSTNGVIWYILGVVFVLTVYPLDIAVVSIFILSWVDTAASTIGRIYGRRTARLPRNIWGIPVPFATRKSVAGFLAGSLTGVCITIGFWGWIAPLGDAPLSWSWPTSNTSSFGNLVVPGASAKVTGLVELGLLGIVGGLVSGVAEALGASQIFQYSGLKYC
ncbi:hypothetical protein CERSUDRAFT_51320 [Gelatoporia subvermispora B]|uniref:Phosphatidate cytidylyltransferase n=1 Tax=Ceriporiopsis subvermispora (strain B) TaxID=914234 RepID=M2PLI4_CERS8|nr:hypothetical protein CERSUDRAFT_51320 [Gelatoporia subvermispora B]